MWGRCPYLALFQNRIIIHRLRGRVVILKTNTISSCLSQVRDIYLIVLFSCRSLLYKLELYGSVIFKSSAGWIIQHVLLHRAIKTLLFVWGFTHLWWLCKFPAFVHFIGAVSLSLSPYLVIFFGQVQIFITWLKYAWLYKNWNFT